MEPSQNSKFFRTALTVVVTAVIQSVILCMIIGLPLPQFFSSRDVESLQFQQMPEQKRTQPLQAIEIKTPEVKSKARSVRHAKQEPIPEPIQEATSVKPEPAIEATPTKVLVVNFDKPSTPAKEEAKQEDVKKETAEEKPVLVPVADKLAGVQADDSQTDSTTDANQNPTDHDAAATQDSSEKSGQ